MASSRRWRRIAALSALALLILTCITLAGLRAAYRATSTYTIRYRVTSTAPSAAVRYSYATLTRSIMTTESVALPWQIELRSDSFLHRTYAQVQANGMPQDQLTCEVWIDGQLAETISGSHIVSCSYDLERNPLP